MDWSVKCLVLAICLTFSRASGDVTDGEVIHAVPAEVNTEPAVVFDKDRAGNEPIKYDGAQLWRVAYSDQEYKNAVKELQKQFQVSMWNLQMSNKTEPYVDMFVKSAMVNDARSFLETSRVPFDVVINDIQDAINTENPPLDEIEHWQNRNGHPMTWTSYHRLIDISNYLDYLTKTYPDLCSQQEIGKSIQGRALKVLRISDGKATNKAVWIDGGIHAREWISPAVVTYIIDTYAENWSEQNEDVRNIDWYFLPVMNPDGYEFTHTRDRLWRKNRRRNTICTGVDLNRNYGYQWGGQGASRQPCAETFAGSGPFSEPETKAVQDFLAKSAGNFKASLSFHSYGQYILYPWGYDRKVPPDHADLDRVGKEGAEAIKKVSGKEYTVGPAGSSLYPAAGGSDDWAKGTLKTKYSYTLELRDTGRYGFMLPANQITETGNEVLAFINVLAKAVAKV